MDVIGFISSCIDLTQSIDAIVQKFRDARSELHEGLRTVSSTRKLLSQFRDLFETSPLPQELLKDYLEDICPLQSELEDIQGFLDSYLHLSSRKGLTGLPWKYRWGRDIDKHQKTLLKLNRNLDSALAAITLKVGLMALESIYVNSPLKDLGDPPAPAYEEKGLSAIVRQYLEAAQDLQDREWRNVPFAQIQENYYAEAKAFQTEEWSRSYCSTGFAFEIELDQKCA